MNPSQKFDHFLTAQDPVYQQVCRELRTGHKVSHWMWFIFPQIAGLGRSPTAIKYALASLQDARAYLAHPILGPRLRQCTELINAIEGRTAHEIFASPDDIKLRSCLTLFAHATDDNADFMLALQTYYQGQYDPATLERI